MKNKPHTKAGQALFDMKRIHNQAQRTKIDDKHDAEWLDIILGVERDTAELVMACLDDHEPDYDTGSYGLRSWAECACGWSGENGGRWIDHFRDQVSALLVNPATGKKT